MNKVLILSVLLLAVTGCRESVSHRVQGYVEGEYLHLGPVSGGRIIALHVAKGESVLADQPLFTLENELETLALAEAQARVEQAKAQRDNLLTGKRPHEIEILENQKNQALANQRLSALQKKRQENLLKSDATSQSRLDEIITALHRDQARVAELNAAIQAAREGGREAEILAAEANLRLAENLRQQAAWHLQQRTVPAPRAGRIEEVMFHAGERVSANQAVLTLLPPENVTIRFFLGAAAIGGMAIGSGVTLSCIGCPGDLTGKISHISSQAVYAPPVLYSREGKEKLVFAIEAIPSAHAERLHPGQPITIDLPLLDKPS
ncbi:MAG: HlyD family efflux transporter periplasmic adaptor subunit [Magnetococcales bacterium]|nr:HlyD family efflux transporter periplasmic adaptor subunit [Magnetococcales bacterium]